MTRDSIEMIERLTRLGLSMDEALQLRRISMTLHRWNELECGDGNEFSSWCISRDETTDKPYLEIHPHTGKTRRTPIADREGGALRRLDKILSAHPDLARYAQGDPRGASLYIYRKSDLDGKDIGSCYSSIGTAVYK